MIQFTDVSFDHRGQQIFTGLTFHLKRGQFMVVSGPARSGKTTLVQLITGMVLPSSGEILINGEHIEEIVASGSKLRDLRRQIGGVGGIYALLGDRTVLENVALAAEIAGQSSPIARKLALEVCRKYKLSHVAAHYPDEISEVERRASQLARAEAARKNIIVADSPADGLDANSARFVNEKLAAIHLAGVSVLYLTSGSGPQVGPDIRLKLVNGTVMP